MTQQFHFTYKGVEYDATDYAPKHPGGLDFLQNMRAVKKDFTEYFRALHSDQAESILKSFRVVGKHEPTQQSEQYMQIYHKLEKYKEPIWAIQILLALLFTLLWFLGCSTSHPVISVAAFALTQVVVGWMGHSKAHSRNKNLNRMGVIQIGLLGGFSMEWWTPKHNMHHMFTNIQKYDQDIQHEYKVYLYAFLYLKWRFDSLVAAMKSANMLEVMLILTNYACLYVFRENIIYWVVGQLIAGFYSAFVLIGNHQNEIRFKENPERTFIDHQIITCRNYPFDNPFWVLVMGGMQYQTEHHLFPQIPFYRLPAAKIIIKQELGKLGKSLIYGPIYE